MTLSNSVSTGIGSIGDQVTQALGGGALAGAVVGAATRAATRAAQRAINQRLARDARAAIGVGLNAAGQIANGDWDGAAAGVFSSGMLNGIFGGLAGLDAQSGFMGTPIPLLGGVTPTEARDLVRQITDTRMAKKNLFLVEVSSAMQGDNSELFNMFAINVQYAPFTLSGDKRKVGGIVLDHPNGTEAVELSLTALDDDLGTIKQFFVDHAGAVANLDGTFNVPSLYAIKFRIVHAFVTEFSAIGAYDDIGTFRPVSIETELDRATDGFEEVHMTFTQIDTCMPTIF